MPTPDCSPATIPTGAGEPPEGSSRALLDFMPCGVLVLTPGGTVSYLNGPAAALWGVPAPATIGCPPAQVQPAVLPAELLSALNQPDILPADYWLPHTQQWIGLRMVPAPDGQRWIFWDNVTDRHQAENARQRSSQLLLAVEEVAHTGSYEVDLTTGSIYFSDGMYRLFGEVPQSFVPTMEFADSRCHPDDVVAVRQILQEAVQTRQPYTYLRRIRRADGQQRTLEAHGEVRCDAAGTPIQFRGLVQDVTERVQAQQANQEASATVEHMLNGAISAICILESRRDEAGHIEDFVFRGANRAAEALNQKTRAEMLGRGLLELFPGVRATLFDTYVRVVETGEPTRLQQYYPHEHYQHWFDVSVVKHGDGVIITFHDVTAQKNAEQELRASHELLQRTIDSSLDLVQVFEAVRDEQGEVVDFTWVLNNAAAEQLYGNVIGQRLCQLNPGVVDIGIFDTFKRVLDTGVPNQAERYYAHEQFNGWFYQSTVKLNDGVTTTTRNVTERKQAEQEIRETKELLQATLDSSHYVVQAFRAVRDASGKIIDFTWILTNQVWLEHHGVPMTGKSLLQENPGVVETGLFELFVQVAETGVPIDHEQYYDHEQFAGWFHQTLVQMGDGFVMNTLNITERKQAQEEILRLKDELAQKVQDRYYSLFTTMEEGVSILEMVYDESGQPVDMRYVEVNPAFEKITGLTNVAGQLTSAVVPTEQHWLDAYDSVVKTGKPLRYENYHAGVGHGQWFRTHTSRIGGPNSRLVANVFEDITERKHREEQLRHAAVAETFRLQLADALGPLTDTAAIQEAVTRLVRLHFDIDRCYYCEIEGEQAIIRHDAAAEGLLSVAGTYSLAEFPLLQAVIQTGRPFAVHDVRQDPLVDESLCQLCVQLQVISYLNVPVMKNGQPAGVLCLVQSEPREWTTVDTALAAEVAERTWAAVERARAEAAQRASEERYRLLFTNMSEGFTLAEMLWDEHGNPVDWRYLEANQAWEQTGVPVSQTIGRTAREVNPRIEPGWITTYSHVVQTGQPVAYESYAEGFGMWFETFAFKHSENRFGLLFRDVTARKQAEGALHQSEAKYRTLFNSMDQGYCIIQLLYDATGQPVDWRYLEVNPAFEKHNGLSNALGKTIRELTPTIEQKWVDIYGHVAATGESQRFEENSDALHRSFDLYAFRVGEPGEGKVAVLFTNITERKRTEEALRQAEETHREQLEQRVARRTRELRESRDLLQSVFDTSLVSMSVLYAVRDEAGQVQDFRFGLVNKELERETGRTDLVGQLCAEQYPGIRQVGIVDLMLRALETGEPQGMEYYYPYEGFDKWYVCQLVKLGDGIVATNLDITERKMAEQERLKNLRLLEQAEAVAGLGSWSYDLAMNTMHWSDGMCQLFGLPLGSPASPSRYLDAVLDEDRPRAEQLVQRLTAGEGFEETLRLRVAEQVKTVRMKAVVLSSEDGQPGRVLGVDLDITELQRLEADNLRLRLTQQQALFEAVQAAQETERKRMAESLHNGIGQILYATKLRLERLRTSLLSTDPSLTAARREAEQLLGEAIRQTRALSHELVPMTLEEFGLPAALQDISQKMSSPRLQLRSHVELDEEAAPLPPALQLALYRMAQELAQNIVKHAHGATAASLELETTPDWVLLRAEDDGPGFVQNPTQSNGLGLRSIRDRVTLLGGHLETGSVPAGGAYVRIRIPLPLDPTADKFRAHGA